MLTAFNRPTLEAIVAACARGFAVSHDALLGRSRRGNLPVARHAIVRLARYYGYTQREIGAELNRVVSTITKSEQVADDLHDTSAAWRNCYATAVATFHTSTNTTHG
jgi:chromosomal replication initiation ATPase DnaA